MLHLLTFFLIMSMVGPVKSPNITAKDVMKKLSKKNAIAFFGKKSLINSSEKIDESPALTWHERRIDSLMGHPKERPKFTKLDFGPVHFEGESAKVSMLFANDSSFGAMISIPYPVKLGKQATGDEFHFVTRNIAKSIGDPSVSAPNYVDYMTDGQQSLFGEFKNGSISIMAWRTGKE